MVVVQAEDFYVLVERWLCLWVFFYFLLFPFGWNDGIMKVETVIVREINGFGPRRAGSADLGQQCSAECLWVAEVLQGKVCSWGELEEG